MKIAFFVSQVKRILELSEGNDTDVLIIYYLNEVRRQYARLSLYQEFLISNQIVMIAGQTSYALPSDLTKIVDETVRYVDSNGVTRQLVRLDNLYIRPEGMPIYWKRQGNAINLIPNTEMQSGEILTFDYYQIPPMLSLTGDEIPEANLADLWMEAVLSKMSRTLDVQKYKLFSQEETQAFKESRAAQD